MWQPPGGGGAWRECRQTLRLEGPNGIADGLIVAAQGLGSVAGRLAPRTGQQDLTATQHTRIGRAQPLLQGLLFVPGQRTDIDGFSHSGEDTTFPNTLRAAALVRLKRAAQITLPAELRKQFHLEEGDYLEAEAVEGGILLKPVAFIER